MNLAWDPRFDTSDVKFLNIGIISRITTPVTMEKTDQKIVQKWEST